MPEENFFLCYDVDMTEGFDSGRRDTFGFGSHPLKVVGNILFCMNTRRLYLHDYGLRA